MAFSLIKRATRAFIRSGIVVAPLCALAISACPIAAPIASGVAGTISLSPACPGPERPGVACKAAYAGAHLQLSAGDGAIIATAESDAKGAFRVPVRPGRYQLRVDVTGAYPRCEPIAVAVQQRKFTSVAIRCDSGMR